MLRSTAGSFAGREKAKESAKLALLLDDAGIDYVTLTGDTADRKAPVDRFNPETCRYS